MLRFVALITLVIIGLCDGACGSWNGDAGSVHSNPSVTGIHYTQHEASVNAARKGAADRLAQYHSGSSSGSSLGANYYSDNSDAETVGEGTVGFTGGSSSKYQAASSMRRDSSQSVGGVPVYPAGESKSSYVSSSQRHTSSSSHNAGQQLQGVYGIGADGLQTRSSAFHDAGYVQPIVATSYPSGQQSSHSSSYSERSSVSNPVITVQVPVVAGDTGSSFSSRSSYSAASDRDIVAPITYSTGGGQSGKYAASNYQESYRYTPANTYVVYSKPVPVQFHSTSHREHDRRDDYNDRYVPVSPVQSGVSSSMKYSTHSDSQRRIQPTPNYIPVAPQTGSSHSSKYEQSSEQRRTIAGGYVPVVPVGSVSETASNYEASSDSQRRLHPTPNFTPVVPATSSSSVSSKYETSEQRRVAADSYVPIVQTGSELESSSTYEASSDTQRRTVPSRTLIPVRNPVVPVYESRVGGIDSTSAYEAAANRQLHANAYVPIVPSGSSSSTAAKYESSEQHQTTAGGYVPVVPVGTSSTSYSSRYANQNQRTGTTGGSYFAPVGSSHTSRNSQSSQHSSSNQYRGGSYEPNRYPITNDQLGRRFGANGNELGDNNELHGIMSESERLARLQSKNVHNGAVTGSAAFEADSRFGGDNDGSSTLTANGFQRTKSWSSQSKWASGQQFDSDGKPKSYSMLSTAESEQHNVNGKKTGYKAATTTLEDDGKVSTYSLHTA